MFLVVMGTLSLIHIHDYCHYTCPSNTLLLKLGFIQQIDKTLTL